MAGHICLDITPKFPQQSKGAQLVPGKLSVVGACETHTGGLVANTGLAMDFFGSQVELLGKVGDDNFGEIVKNAMNRSGVKQRIKTDPSDSTSYSIVIAQPNVDRIFLHCPGVNDTFTSKDITDDDLENKRLFHFGYPTLMRQMYANGGAELTKIFRKVYEKNIVTSLDLAVPDPEADSGKADWETILRNTLPYVDIFVPSFEELCYMLDRDRYDELCGKDDMCLKITVSDLARLADRCLDLGASCVLIKAGAAGIYYASAKQCRFVKLLGLDGNEWQDIRGFMKSYKPDCILSGTGAGDSAIAAFLSAMLRKYGFEHSVRLAAAEGALCVQSYDALSALLPFEEAEKKIGSGWEQQNLIGE